MTEENLQEAKRRINECLEKQNPELGLGWFRILDVEKEIPELLECTHLQSLDLGSNQIQDISFLENLNNLKHLELGWNQIQDISFLENLNNLKHLDLSSNQIQDISFLENLNNLKHLELGWNQIQDISFLENLNSLQHLDLRSNQIQDIPFLENLNNLKHLELSSNQIQDISFLENLNSLQHLELRSNQISDIPFALFKQFPEYSLDWESNGLIIGNNPLKSPPLEVFRQGRQSVLDWYAANKKALKEIKIVLIGEPDAGKTSLLRRLKENKFKEKEAQTDGINIESITFGKNKHFKNQKEIHDLTAHFWDFGGQEILSATHQFFLSNRSVYVLLLDARQDKDITNQIRKWVKQIIARGGNSPILVLANQIDVNPGFGFLNEDDLKEEFPQIKAFLKISCKTKKNLEEFKKQLEKWIPEAELFGSEIDERWFPIKEKLQELTQKESFLNQKKFYEICEKNGLSDKKSKENQKRLRKDAIAFFNSLGLLLHFDEIKLADYFVLDPYWITYGVYQILTSQKASENKGKIHLNDLDYIINEEPEKIKSYETENAKKITYSPNERKFLVDVLADFKLSYSLSDDEFILPNLLETEKPKEAEAFEKTEKKIQFVYQYPFPANSIMVRVIVALHSKIIKNKKRSLQWRTGCILENGKAKALVSNYDEKIEITVIGNQKRELLSWIRGSIQEVNEGLNEPPSELIPLPDNLAYVDYEELLEREKDGETEYKIYKPEKRSFKISELLDGISRLNEFEKKVLANQEKMLSKQDKLAELIQETSQQEKEAVLAEITKYLIALEEEMNLSQQEEYQKVKLSDNLDAKLKLSIPFINMLGIDLGITFDIKNWAKEMYQKHKYKLYELFY